MSEIVVPDGWGRISIGELGRTFNGLTKKTAKDFGGGEYFINYLQVFNNTLSDKEKCGLVKIIDGEKQSQVIYGDILFTTSSETPNEIGYTAVFLEKDWSPYLNSFCFGVRPESFNKLIPEYANYLFSGVQFRQLIKPLAQGSTRFNLSKENLKKLEISFPSLPEQQKIASILTSVDEVIEKTQSQINKLQDLKKGTMNELLTKGICHTEFKDSPVGKIPVEWRGECLQDVLLELVDCEHKTAPYVENSEYLVVRTSNVRDGRLQHQDMKFTTLEGYNEWTKRSVPIEKDILFTREAPAGESCLVPEGKKVCLGQSVCRQNILDY